MTSNVPFSLVGIDHVVLLVDDMEKALAFYHDVLADDRVTPTRTWHGAGLVRRVADRALGYHSPRRAQGCATGGGGRNVDHVCISDGTLRA